MKIRKYYTSYSKKKGAYQKSVIVEKNLTLEEALTISKEKYGNKDGEMQWRSGRGMLYPDSYKIVK